MSKHIYDNRVCENECQAIETILNLADKKQKEIEEKNVAINKMSKDISRQLKEIERLKINLKTTNNFNYFAHQQILENLYVSKDKIREKIKEIDGKGTFDAKIVLEHLLEEK